MQGIFENGWLKIISLGIAIALWLFVTNYQDPETVLTMNNVPVRILHMDTITSEGKTCTVLDDSDIIPVVTISAPRSVVDALSTDNIIATADVQEMAEENMVPIVITTNKYRDAITSITSSIRYVKLSIEDEVTRTFPIELSVTGSVAEGCQIGQVTLEQNQVRVTGPESEVARVAGAGVTVDVSGTENNISTNAEIHLYNEDGRDIRLDENEGNLLIRISNNGKPPKGPVTESGGLLSLRRSVEEAKGSMAVESTPAFALILRLPANP